MTTLRERLAQMGEVARLADSGRVEMWSEEGIRAGGRCDYSVCVEPESPEHDCFATAHARSENGAFLRAQHIATFSPDVAAALVAVAEAARLTRAANAGGNFDDVVATGKVLDGALDALATALGVSR